MPDLTKAYEEDFKAFDDKFVAPVGSDIRAMCACGDAQVMGSEKDVKAFIAARFLPKSYLLAVLKEMRTSACFSERCGHKNVDPNSVNHGKFVGKDQAISDLIHTLQLE